MLTTAVQQVNKSVSILLRHATGRAWVILLRRAYGGQASDRSSPALRDSTRQAGDEGPEDQNHSVPFLSFLLTLSGTFA
jgi:hypothetical protein